MNNWSAVLYGIVEGITEFLPVSSTAHLILTGKLLGEEESEFFKTFKIAIQLGAIFSVVVLYWRTLFIQNRQIVQRLLVAFVPTGILGWTFYKIIRDFLESQVISLASLCIGGLILIVFELFHKEKEGDEEEKVCEIPYWKCFVIGLCQSLAMVPGTSRSAATILGGLALGLKRKTIVEFSFLLAVPTMAAATAYDLYKNGASFSTSEFKALGIGLIVSFVVAILAIRLLLRFIRTHSFISFGIYRIVIAIALWFILGRPMS